MMMCSDCDIKSVQEQWWQEIYCECIFVYKSEVLQQHLYFIIKFYDVSWP